MASGNSLAVTLPADFVREFGLRKGESVDLSIHPTTGVVTIRPGVRHVEEGRATPRFRAQVDGLLRRRKGLYRKLAR